MIRIKSGYYPYKNTLKKAGDTLRLPTAEEARLVSLGVADYINTAPFAPVNMDGEGVATNENGIEMPETESTSPEGTDGTDGEITPPANDDDNSNGGTDGDGDGEDDLVIPPYDINSHPSTLRAIAKKCGISFPVGTTKEDIVKALDEFFNEGEPEPDLNAEAPVV